MATTPQSNDSIFRDIPVLSGSRAGCHRANDIRSCDRSHRRVAESVKRQTVAVSCIDKSHLGHRQTCDPIIPQNSEFVKQEIKDSTKNREEPENYARRLRCIVHILCGQTAIHALDRRNRRQVLTVTGTRRKD